MRGFGRTVAPLPDWLLLLLLLLRSCGLPLLPCMPA
jgi:hypothetical protein